MLLSGAAKRVAECVAREVMFLVEFFGIARLGFLTLTFKEKRVDAHWSQERWAYLVRKYLKDHFLRIIAVWERHESDGIHWHCLVVCNADIKTGFQHDRYRELQKQVRAGVRRGWKAAEVGANAALQAEWKWLKANIRGVWGRCELTPIRVSGDAVARYLAKYVTKQARERRIEDKGCRRVRFVGFRYSEVVNGRKEARTHRKVTPRFSFIGAKSIAWRAKVEAWAANLGLNSSLLYGPVAVMGPRWCWDNMDAIRDTDCREILREKGKYGEKALEFVEKEIADKEFLKVYNREVAKVMCSGIDASTVTPTPETLGLQWDMDRWAGGMVTPEAAESLGWSSLKWPQSMVDDYLAWCKDSTHQLGDESCAWFAYRETCSENVSLWDDLPWADTQNENSFTGNRIAASCPVERDFHYDSAG